MTERVTTRHLFTPDMAVPATPIDPSIVERPFPFRFFLDSERVALIINDSVILASAKGRIDQALLVTRRKGVPVGDAAFFGREAPTPRPVIDEFPTLPWYVRNRRPDRNVVYIGRDWLKVVCLDVRKGRGIDVHIESPVPLRAEVIGWRLDFGAILASRNSVRI